MAYIDKDLAIKTAIDMCVKVVGHGITQFDAVDIADAFENIPTADVVEVKHGEWVDNEIQDSILSKCSVCGFSCGAYTFNYCPNCGAKMDGKEDA